MTPETKQRIRDHELLCNLFCLAERYVQMLEQVQSLNAAEKREVLRAIAREDTLGRILGT